MNSVQIPLKAEAIVNLIEQDLLDRPAFREEWKQLSREGREQLKTNWQAMIERELRGPARKSHVKAPRR